VVWKNPLQALRQQDAPPAAKAPAVPANSLLNIIFLVQKNIFWNRAGVVKSRSQRFQKAS
jgi:hypothetical protein